MTKIYYHFTNDRLRDDRPVPPVGEWLTHDGDVIMCESGLHASETPYDALQYAPGPMLHQVELDGIACTHRDKVVAKRRKIVATIDATDLMRTFARKQALTCIHLWDCPAITREYLETGREDIRSAAWNAARGATRRATVWGSAAWGSAAWRAAWSAARSVAQSAAADSAWRAAWCASADSAWCAAWCASADSAWRAAWGASADSAEDSAWRATWNDARTAAGEMFNLMVEEAFKERRAGRF